eukprot:2304018-Prymnesium_polylepis.1
MHVEHREDADLDAAMRAAEDAVQQKLGYTINLVEKPLFDSTAAADHSPLTDPPVLQADEDDLMSAEEDEEP